MIYDKKIRKIVIHFDFILNIKGIKLSKIKNG